MTVLAETTILALEQGITDRLKARVSGLTIEPYPDRPDGYRLLHQVGAILICYRGAEYSAVQDVGDVVQERRLFFDLHLLTRQLSGHQGAYAHLEAMRVTLTGYRVPGFRKLTPRREAFLGHKEGVWTHALTMSAATIAAELDEATTGAMLSRLTLTSDYTNSEISGG